VTFDEPQARLNDRQNIPEVVNNSHCHFSERTELLCGLHAPLCAGGSIFGRHVMHRNGWVLLCTIVFMDGVIRR
jgi:hypothetical protein